MKTSCKIVGIVLVKDEDMYIERVIQNILHFCDAILIDDNCSQDQTYPILQRLAAEHPIITLYQSSDLRHSHTLLEPFAGTNTWVFGVDGDEIYDPVGLGEMRRQLLQGAFAEQWCVFGNVLHCVSLDRSRKIAKGYLAPPSRSMTKLYNFSLIESWTDCYERLHSGNLIFKHGYHAGLRYQLGETRLWEESPFRCLHTVFLKRSSREKHALLKTRLDPAELLQMKRMTSKGLWAKLVSEIRWKAKLVLRQDWKHQYYRKGPLMKKDVTAFFPMSGDR